MNGYTGLGFDPAPGDVEHVRVLAEAFALAGRQIEDATDRIAGTVAGSAGWQGMAADEFRRRGSALPRRLANQRDTTATAAELLFAWATTLADLKSQAERYDRRARELTGRLDAAQQVVEEWLTAVSVASTHTRPQAAATLAAHERARDELQAELDAVRDAARQLAAEHERAADQVAARLEALVTGSPAPPAGRKPAADLGAVLGGLAGRCRRANVVAALVPATDRPATTTRSSGPRTAVLAMADRPDTSRAWTFAAAVPVDQLLRGLGADVAG